MPALFLGPAFFVSVRRFCFLFALWVLSRAGRGRILLVFFCSTVLLYVILRAAISKPLASILGSPSLRFRFFSCRSAELFRVNNFCFIFAPGNFTPGVTGATAFVSVVCRFSSPLAA
jgi:hypothetical protein